MTEEPGVRWLAPLAFLLCCYLFGRSRSPGMSRRTQRAAHFRGRAATTLASLAIAASSLAPGAQARAHTRAHALGGGGDVQVIVLPAPVRDSMNAMFTRYNKHWDELAETNTLAQMLGSGQPTQLEYMGCLRGRVARDTLWVSGWVTPRGMRQLQFAVTGDCDRLSGVVGTWHTHPYRADSAGPPL